MSTKSDDKQDSTSKKLTDDSSKPSTPESKDSKGQPAPGGVIKRIRIPIACVTCRHKKIKCDGQTPCSHCEKFKVDCIYPVATKPVNQEYVETLENRLKSVESHLKELLARGMSLEGTPLEEHLSYPLPSQPLHNLDEDPSHSYPSSATGTSPAPSQTLLSRMSHMDVSRSSTPTTRPNKRHSDTPGHLPIVEDECSRTLDSIVGSLRVSQDGCARYLPKLTGGREESFADARTYGSSKPAGLYAADIVGTLDWETVDLPQPYTLPTAILPPKAIATLMNVYFNSVHTFMPILHKASFLSLCQDGEYRIPPFLLMSMLAVASRHLSVADIQQIPGIAHLKGASPGGSAGSGKRQDENHHHALFDYARTLLDTFLDIPRLSTIQGLLLLTYYQTKEKRSGHFLRARMYLSMATRMAKDMGLSQISPHDQQTFETATVQTTNTGDSVSSVDEDPSYHQRHSNQRTTPTLQDPSQGATETMLEKQVVIQQECQLAWLGCYFLDGLTSDASGQECLISNSALDVPALMREATTSKDTTHGAALIFWYHHLQLIHIQRRICGLNRSRNNAHSSNHQWHRNTVDVVHESTEVQSIDEAMRNWIQFLPSHLVYLDSPGLPSYYTLYLHRFYYSLKILLYRPLISSSTLRGQLSESKSPISICTQSALLMTRIGETIFQNYSWPWPGCGLFGYHMIQAAEMHVFSMVLTEQMMTGSMTESVASEAQDLFGRTINLVKGYISLAGVTDLQPDVTTLEQTVKNYVLSRPSRQQQYQPRHPMDHLQPITPFAILQQQHQQKQWQQQQQQQRRQQPQHQHQHQHQHQSQDIPSDLNHMPGTTLSKGPTSPQDTQMLSPSIQSSNVGFYSSFGLQQTHHHSQVPQYHHQQQNPDDVHHYGHSYQEDPSGIFGPSSIPLYSPSSTALAGGDLFAFLQPSATLTPISELLNLSNNINAAGPSSIPGGSQSHGQRSEGTLSNSDPTVRSTTSVPSALPCVRTGAHPTQGGSDTFSLPPPKPPKRLLYQSTGSTTSSNRSASQKPPVPKKPTRLVLNGGTFPDNCGETSNDNSPGASNNPSSSSAEDRSMMPPPNAAPTRPIRVLPAQGQLYGMGALINSLAPDQSSYPPPMSGESLQPTSMLEQEDDLDYADTYALEFWQTPNPQMAGRRAPIHNGRVL
ncbi:hypothetical protein BGZ81_008069 [Podila clonocystis]|nr:hypothetical protein BGZ81_008069 [Podila clonocystis]